MQGITALPGAQQAPQQPQAPGQAAPAQALPQQQPMTPQAMTGQLQNLPPQQLLQMFANPADKTPKWAVVTAYAKAVEQQRLQEMVRGQQAMQQGQMQAQEMPVAAQVMSQPVMARHGGEMHSYAGGGAVAFQSGGPSVGYDRDYNDARRFGISLSPYDAPDVRAEKLARVQRMREFEAQQAAQGRAEIPTEASVQAETALKQAFGDQASRMRDIPPVGIAATPAAAPAPAPRPPRANRPGTGIAAAAPAPVAPPAPPVDRYGDIEQEGIAGIKALQDMLRKQGEVDPELARLRQAAYESAQGIATRRERDRLAALEAAQKAAGAPLLENQEALLRMAASLGGAKRFGESLSRLAGAAGEVRGEQRKALEAAQKFSREEQNAIDQLNQALAEKRVADRSGDVNRQQEANVKVAEAQLKVTDLRKGLQTQRGVEADREEQRKIAREQMANQLKVAQIGAAARESASNLAEQRLALQELRARPDYKSVVDRLTKAKEMYAISKSPRAKAELEAAQKAANDLAAAYGISPGMMGMGGGAEPSAAPTAGNDPLGIRKP